QLKSAPMRETAEGSVTISTPGWARVAERISDARAKSWCLPPVTRRTRSDIGSNSFVVKTRNYRAGEQCQSCWELPNGDRVSTNMSAMRMPLEVMNIDQPCPADWDQMRGTGATRFCGHCQKNVYNLSMMT